jgi:hypothetical protein
MVQLHHGTDFLSQKGRAIMKQRELTRMRFCGPVPCEAGTQRLRMA